MRGQHFEALLVGLVGLSRRSRNFLQSIAGCDADPNQAPASDRVRERLWLSGQTRKGRVGVLKGGVQAIVDEAEDLVDAPRDGPGVPGARSADGLLALFEPYEPLVPGLPGCIPYLDSWLHPLKSLSLP